MNTALYEIAPSPEHSDKTLLITTGFLLDKPLPCNNSIRPALLLGFSRGWPLFSKNTVESSYIKTVLFCEIGPLVLNSIVALIYLPVLLIAFMGGLQNGVLSKI